MINYYRDNKRLRVLLLCCFALTTAAYAAAETIQVSNLSSSSAAMSWTTSDSVDVSVRYGLTPALGDSAVDVAIDDAHMVTIAGLTAETQYYFEVRSGLEVDNNGGAYYTFTTTSSGTGLPSSVYGKVFDDDAVTAEQRAIVTMVVKDNSGNISYPQTSLTNAGGIWTMNLGNLKDSSTNGVFNFSVGDTVFVSAVERNGVTEVDTLIVSGTSPQDLGTLTLVRGCCGNVDSIIGAGGPIDVSDLTYLVAYLFKSGPPAPCEDEGNVDSIVGAGGPIDVSDLTFLVGYLFKGGPTPPAC